MILGIFSENLPLLALAKGSQQAYSELFSHRTSTSTQIKEETSSKYVSTSKATVFHVEIIPFICSFNAIYQFMKYRLSHKELPFLDLINCYSSINRSID